MVLPRPISSARMQFCLWRKKKESSENWAEGFRSNILYDVNPFKTSSAPMNTKLYSSACIRSVVVATLPVVPVEKQPVDTLQLVLSKLIPIFILP